MARWKIMFMNWILCGTVYEAGIELINPLPISDIFVVMHRKVFLLTVKLEARQSRKSWSPAKHCNEDRNSRLMSTTNRQGQKDWTHWSTGIMDFFVCGTGIMEIIVGSNCQPGTRLRLAEHGRPLNSPCPRLNF
nr:uncharacterized protein LOC120974875 [Aegilops tauschii subsp. strangulata]